MAIYRDIYINIGADFSEVINLSKPFDELELQGAIKSSLNSSLAVPISFESIAGQSNRALMKVAAEDTLLLQRRRGVYDVFSTDTNGVVEKEREGVAHYSGVAAFGQTPPPQSYYISISNVVGLGSVASYDVEFFAEAEHEHPEILSEVNEQYLQKNENITGIQILTQYAYEAIDVKNPQTLYLITEDILPE
jgi:hypothetical protein